MDKRIDNQSESTENITDIEFNEWADKLSKMDDEDASRAVLQRVLENSDLYDSDKELLKDAYEYCMKLIHQGKPLEIDLLKIYLGDIKNYKVNDVNLYNLIILLGCCGICFDK